MIFITWLVQCLLILLTVAFFTLFERKVMGLFHLRVGPNKVSFIGLLQPLLDAFKLLTKQNLTPFRANKFIYNLAPMMALILSLFVWMTMPNMYLMLSMNYSMVLFFCISSIMVFSVLMAGWSSNSKYSLMGSLRSVAQSISYESVFSTILVMILVMISSYSIRSFMSESSLLFLMFFPLWVICTLAETHRAPFDFSESESELVSGFNTEYSGAYFAFIFLSEYAMLIYSCLLMTYIFMMWLIPLNFLLITIITLFMSFLFIWIRVTYCRFRYDMLMMMSWKILLPFSLLLFMSILIILI